MKSELIIRKTRVASPSPAAILPAIFLALIAAGCSGPQKMDGGNVHTIVLHVGNEECFAAPQVTHANAGDLLVFFVADANSTATVNNLDQRPLPKGTTLTQSHVEERNPDGSPLSDIESLDISQGHYDRVQISTEAKGVYELRVECGGKTDDPPKVVVW